MSSRREPGPGRNKRSAGKALSSRTVPGARDHGLTLPILPASVDVEFENVSVPPANIRVVELTVNGFVVDLRRYASFVGLTYGPGDELLTLAWSLELPKASGEQRLQPIGLTLTIAGVDRFESSFQEGPPRRLESMEFRVDPEPTLVFFFEGGTIRVSGAIYTGKLLFDDSESAPSVQ